MPRSLRPIPGLVALALLAACVQGGGTPPNPGAPQPPQVVEDACGAAGLQGLVGQDESALAGMRFKGPMRLIRPGMAVTMDYSAERLNITLHDAGRIESVTCG